MRRFALFLDVVLVLDKYKYCCDNRNWRITVGINMELL